MVFISLAIYFADNSIQQVMDLYSECIAVTEFAVNTETILQLKNAAKRSRQHAENNREYAQRRVCVVNEQVP